MIRKFLMTSVAGAAVLATQATAQDVIELEDIIISGGLTPVAADATGRAVSVVTAEEIEARGITTVQNALRALPGVAVSSAGSSPTQVRLRGGEGNHTLVLIDGVEVAGGDGEYFFSGLETANIERIEVLRGPQSAFYGSNASAGVINIITRKGDIGTGGSVSLETGDATTATAFLSTRGDEGGLALSLAHTNDPGYDHSGDVGEKDGLERTSMNLSGDYHLTPDLKLGFTLRTSDENFDSDCEAGSFGSPCAGVIATNADEYVVDDSTLSSSLNETSGAVYAEYLAMGGQMSHRLSYEKTSNNRTSPNGTATDTSNDALKYRLSYALDGSTVENAAHLVNVLAERERDSSASNPLYARDSKSIALEYRGSFENGLDVQIGLRRDDNNAFRDATTWNAALSYELGNGVRLHGSAGKGTVNPSYSELFGDAFGSLGNPDLLPEENRSFDLGAEFTFADGAGLIDITWFRERLTNEIVFDIPAPGVFSFANQADKSTREGVEITADYQLNDVVDLRLSYTYLDASNANGSVEIRRPQHELALGVTAVAFGGQGEVSADIRHVSGNFDTQFWGFFETTKLPAYTTLDVAAQYDLTDSVTLTGRVENVFDSETSDVWGFANRGRAAYIGLSARF